MVPVRLNVHAQVVRDPELGADRASVAALPGAVRVRLADHLAARESVRAADVRVRPVVELGVVGGDLADAAVDLGAVAGDGAAGADEGSEERGDREEGKSAQRGRRHNDGSGGGSGASKKLGVGAVVDETRDVNLKLMDVQDPAALLYARGAFWSVCCHRMNVLERRSVQTMPWFCPQFSR